MSTETEPSTAMSQGPILATSRPVFSAQGTRPVMLRFLRLMRLHRETELKRPGLWNAHPRDLANSCTCRAPPQCRDMNKHTSLVAGHAFRKSPAWTNQRTISTHKAPRSMLESTCFFVRTRKPGTVRNSHYGGGRYGKGEASTKDLNTTY